MRDDVEDDEDASDLDDFGPVPDDVAHLDDLLHARFLGEEHEGACGEEDEVDKMVWLVNKTDSSLASYREGSGN